jgi:hypothetical protein
MPKKNYDRFVFASPKRKPEAGDAAYKLVGPADYDDYLKRYNSGQATREEEDEFDLRMIQRFIDCVYADKAPEPWILRAIADAFMNVLYGGRWEDEFPLPWTKINVPFTRAEWRGIEIYCAIRMRHEERPSEDITAIMDEVADEWGVSYELARDHYYAWQRKRDDSKKP